MSLLPSLLPAALLVTLLSGLLRRNALRWGLIDIPNERSSHDTPVPRGGGVAVALVFLCFLPLLQRQAHTAGPLFLALYGAGTLIALVGFLDDRGHIPARKRLIAHFAAAAWILYHLFPALGAGAAGDWLLAGGFALCLVWLLNLYNFMDGIDAITGSETLSVCLAAAFLSWRLLPDDPSWTVLLLLASCVAGFLVWNLPPARLFMGDAGSAFLGIALGALAVHAFRQAPPLFHAWLVLLGVYIVDASVTLARRILAGEKFYQAHRTHAYQHAAIRYGSHGRISLAIALINLLWLFPLAAAVALEWIHAALGIAIGYLPLVVLAFHFKAGVRTPPPTPA